MLLLLLSRGFDNLLELDDKGDVSIRDNGSGLGRFSRLIQISAERENVKFLSNVVSAMEASRMMDFGCQAFLAYVLNSGSKELRVHDICTVCDFLGVFPEELSGLSPSRDVEVGIELYENATPVSISPYRMALKEVLHEFLDHFLFVFIDDNIMYSRTEEEHDDHLPIVLQALLDNQLYAKLSKCEFWLQEVVFLGKVVSKDSIRADP
ncbi:hypothetical protein GQ457_06G013330 [Hibiscus cannabinus]